MTTAGAFLIVVGFTLSIAIKLYLFMRLQAAQDEIAQLEKELTEALKQLQKQQDNANAQSNTR